MTEPARDPPASAPPAPAPVPPGEGATREGERLPGLDVLRGLALLGILPANLPSFALPAAPSDDVVHFMSPAVSEAVAHGVLRAVVAEKFITLFALLFGAGLALQRGRSLARADEGFYPRTLWRLLLLGGLGLAHAILVWHGDVLFYYATIGVAALALSSLAPRWLLGLGGVSLLVPPIMLVGAAALIEAFGVPGGMEVGGPPTLEAALAAPHLDGGLGVGVGREVAIFRSGTYPEQLSVRATHWLYVFSSVVMFYGWRVLGLFLLGLAAHRLGLLSPGPRERTVLRRLLAAGLVVGVPIEVYQGVLHARGPLPVAFGLRLEALHQLGSLSLALVYASAVLLLPTTWYARAPLRWLGNVGRTALSNYLSQSVLCTFVFYSWGLGLFATLTRAQLWGVAAIVWVVQLTVSALWLRWFVMGPVEWAWRSLTWWSPQPLVRR